MEKSEDRKKLVSDLEIRVLTEADAERVLEFMVENYSMQQPIRMVFRVSSDVQEFDRIRIVAKIKNGVSLGLFGKTTGELVYVEMNSILDKSEFKSTEPEFDYSKEEGNVITFLEYLEGDLFEDLKAERIFWMSMCTMAEKYRGMGLFGVMRQFREKLAASRRCDYLAATATSNFLLRASVKQGFEILREVEYCDYVDPRTGSKPPDLRIHPIHTSAAVIYQRVAAVSGNA